MRNNVFEILMQEVNVKDELNKIIEVFENNVIIRSEGYEGFDVVTYDVDTIEMINVNCFCQWKNRCCCWDYNDMKEKLHIDDILTHNGSNVHDIIIVFEFVFNMLNLLDNKKKEHTPSNEYELEFCIFTEQYYMLKGNCNSLLDKLNLKATYFGDEEKVIITEKSAQVTAVAEIVNEDLVKPVIEYNHHTLKGNIEAKKDILLKLYEPLEPERKKMKQVGLKLEGDLFDMFNKFNLRHNNVTESGNYYIQKIANMPIEELEDWYDEIYQMCLLCILELDHIERKKKIKEFKQNL